MKSILLTSTALVAFAGAAAADISFSGEASFSYNSDSGNFTSDTAITASGSTALDNGYTATASITFDGEDDSLSHGDITVASDTASITYNVGGDAVAASHLGDPVGKMDTGVLGWDAEKNLFADEDNVEEDTRISASATFGGVTIRGSIPDEDGEYALGVATDLGGMSADFGIITDDEDSGFGVKVSGSAGGADYTVAIASDSDGNSANGLTVATTAGGVDLTLDAGNGGWEAGASMPLGGASVGFTYDDANYWTASVETSLDAVELGLTVDSNSDWDLTASYDAGDMTFGFATDENSDWSVDATYDLGNGVTAGAGTDSDSDSYAEVSYDLGAGASAGVVWANFSDDDYDYGTTVSVSFSF